MQMNELWVWILLILTTIFMHIVDDFYLQGSLAQMKQKSWWLDHPSYNDMYKYDYIVALITHGFSWSFMIHLPSFLLMVYFKEITNASSIILLLLVLMQAELHSIVDHLKANKKYINLVTDQTLHMIQIIISLYIIWHLV